MSLMDCLKKDSDKSRYSIKNIKKRAEVDEYQDQRS